MAGGQCVGTYLAMEDDDHGGGDDDDHDYGNDDAQSFKIYKLPPTKILNKTALVKT